MIVIIDYGMGNLRSIANMLKRIGVSAKISSNEKEILLAKKIILPGVGSFDTGINNIRQGNFENILQKKIILEKTPVLGICLGMQILGKSSEEGKLPGLGWIDAEVRKFDSTKLLPKLKIPNMGWNHIEIKRATSLVENLNNESRFYFVHSYHMVNFNEKDVVAKTEYGYEFTSIVEHENIMGVQFHPEKSHKFGMMLFKNFVEKY
jgi:imidazole glycerol-phosphate synthase subunit HisH